MKSKIHAGFAAILLLLAVSCSKDNSNTSTLTPGSGSTSNNRSGSISSSETSNAYATTMDDAQINELNIIGQWVLYYDWGCDGAPGASVTTFNADGTWSNDQGYTGIWVKGRHMLMFTFNNSETTYSGNIFSEAIKGIQTTFEYAGSLQGCFNMVPYTGSIAGNHYNNTIDASGKQK